MASQIRRILYNTRERLLSGDLNSTTDLIHRAIAELGVCLTGREAGVIQGFQVTQTGVGLGVSVSRGLAMFPGGAATANDSTFHWVELEAADTFDLPAANPSNPRWDVIEIASNDIVLTTESRDIFNPASGVFVPQQVDKTRGSDPTIVVRSGTAAATPTLPSGITGRIPLAYVLVPAASVTLPANSLLHCKPLLRTRDEENVGAASPVASIRGGGVSHANVVSLALTLRSTHGRVPGSSMRFSIAEGASFTPSAGYTDGGALPVADDVLYIYAVPPPYPSGYSSLAAREFVVESAAAAVFGAGVSTSVTGCVLLASASEPAITLQGAPSSGSGTITDTVWSASPVSSPRANWVYLGNAPYDQSSNTFRVQSTRGSWTDLGQDFAPRGTITGGSETVDFRAPAGGRLPLPVTSGSLRLLFAVSLISGEAMLVTPVDGLWDQSYQLGPGGSTSAVHTEQVTIFDENGSVFFTRVDIDGTPGDPTVGVMAYQDVILALR